MPACSRGSITGPLCTALRCHVEVESSFLSKAAFRGGGWREGSGQHVAGLSISLCWSLLPRDQDGPCSFYKNHWSSTIAPGRCPSRFSIEKSNKNTAIQCCPGCQARSAGQLLHCMRSPRVHLNTPNVGTPSKGQVHSGRGLCGGEDNLFMEAKSENRRQGRAWRGQ